MAMAGFRFYRYGGDRVDQYALTPALRRRRNAQKRKASGAS